VAAGARAGELGWGSGCDGVCWVVAGADVHAEFWNVYNIVSVDLQDMGCAVDPG
jgi:hypothetical protein